MRVSDGIGRLLAQLALRAGAVPAVEAIRSTPWMSLTLSGARHRIVLRFEGSDASAAADRLAAGLEAAEFDLGRHILADVGVRDRADSPGSAALIIEALTVASD